MKRLGMFLVLLSVSMFALGCGEGKKKEPEKNTPAAGTTDSGTGGAAGETKDK